MLSLEIEPRFGESDPLGHVNNTVLPVWFEQARNPIFRIFNPDLDLDKWNIILKKFEVEFNRQIYFGKAVEIRSCIEHVGNSSLVIAQQACQNGEIAASGKTVMVYFDYINQKTMPIPNHFRKELEQFVC